MFAMFQIRGQASAEELEKDSAPVDEIADYAIGYVPYDKPTRRTIIDYFKLEQADKAKKLKLDTIIAAQRKTQSNHYFDDLLRTDQALENQLNTFQKSIAEMLTAWKNDQDLRLNKKADEIKQSIDVLSKKIDDNIFKLTCKHKNHNLVAYKPLVSNVTKPHVAFKIRQNATLYKPLAYPIPE